MYFLGGQETLDRQRVIQRDVLGPWERLLKLGRQVLFEVDEDHVLRLGVASFRSHLDRLDFHRVRDRGLENGPHLRLTMSPQLKAHPSL